jgi:hypothetical protein
MSAQRGIYTVRFRAASFTTANGDYDFFELTPADDRPIELCGLLLSVKTEVGDAQEEMLDYGVVTDNATTGNGTSTTPNPLGSRDAAAGFTAETVASTPASTGTAIELVSDNFNVRAGLQLWLPEQYRPRVDQADVMMCVRLFTALADDATLSGTAWVREV